METKSIEELQEELAQVEAEEQRVKSEGERLRAEIRKGQEAKHAIDIERVRAFMKSVDVTYEDLAPLQVTPTNKDAKAEPKASKPKRPTFKHPKSEKPIFKVGPWHKTIKKLIDEGFTFEELVINKADTERLRVEFIAGPKQKK